MARSHHRGAGPERPSKRVRRGFANPNSPKLQAARKRHMEWVELWLSGHRQVDIAERYDVSKGTVSEAIKNMVREREWEKADELRELWLERMEHTIGKLLPHLNKAKNPKACADAANALTRVCKRVSEITGMDKPARAPVNDKGETVDPFATLTSRLDRLAAASAEGGAVRGDDPGAAGPVEP